MSDQRPPEGFARVPGTFERACPECGAQVSCRFARACSVSGDLPWAFEVALGPEHETSCKHWRQSR